MSAKTQKTAAGQDEAQRLPAVLDVVAQAECFLKAIGPKAKDWLFLTYNDYKCADPVEGLTTINRGNIGDPRLRELLRSKNKAGAGVYVKLNKTVGNGLKADDVTMVRSVMLDLDGASLEPVLYCPLRPHVIVETSPGRYHAYWRVKDFPLEKYVAVQRGLAKRFDGDPGVAKLSVLARLPGFKHMKDGDGRHTVKLVAVNDLPGYSYKQIASEFPPADKPHRMPQSRAGLVILDPNNPLKTCEEWLRRQVMVEGAEAPPVWCFHYYRNTFYRYVGTHFQEIDEIWLRNALYAFLSTCHLEEKKTNAILPFIPEETKVQKIIKALQPAVYLPDRFDDGPQVGERRNPPFWIDGRESGNNLIACRNGLLDLETETLTPNSPAFFNINSLPFDYDPNAAKPKRWNKFLRELWPGDEGKQSRMTLQEMFGLMLIVDTSYQKIFLIIGPKRSGKGTIGRVLRRLIGTDNVACPTMASMGGEYGLWPLIDKQVAIISDARVQSQDAQKIAERLLSVSGEDGVTTNRKYQSFWTGQLGARFLIMTNKPPRIADASGALVSRYVVLTLTESFYGREQKDLAHELYKEMPGILNWAIQGLERLRCRDGTDRPGFIIPKQSRHMIKALDRRLVRSAHSSKTGALRDPITR